MKKVRIIARLDVKGPNVIKGIQFECLRVMGKPKDLAEKYYLQGVDELIYLDTVANLYQRQNLFEIVNSASENIFVPFTVGGGIRTLEDIRVLLKAGADKVAINTAATKNPELIRQAAKTFGSQCIVSSIEAKKIGENKWEAYTDCGRQNTGLDVLEWAKKVEALGAGEILLTSVDMEGTQRGFDWELIEKVAKIVNIPVIASGGAGKLEDISKCIKECSADAVAIASILHYNKYGLVEIKEYLSKENIEIRKVPEAIKIITNPALEYDITDYNKYTLWQLKEEKRYELNLLNNESNQLNDKSRLKEEQKEKNFMKQKGGFISSPKYPLEIGVIDYGINNVKSVVKAFQKIGKKVGVVNSPEGILTAKSLVLPGVGAFKDGMDALKERGLILPLCKRIKERTPLLGICLGMQLLFSESEEFGLHQGLNLIKGRVVPLKSVEEVKIKNYKVPHIGWNELYFPSFLSQNQTELNSFSKKILWGDSVYFVHSYYSLPEEKNIVVATTKYGEQEFCVMIKKDKIMATQFHPERSGEVGLQILRTFCEENKIP